MNQRTFRMRRRVGAALLAGVTALGVATLAGEGVANAATPTVTTTATVTTIAGATKSGAYQNGGAITLSVNGTTGSGDTITLTVGCQSGALSFVDNHTTLAQTVNGVTAPGSGANSAWAVSFASSGACGSSVTDELVLTAPSTAETNPTIVIGAGTGTAGIEYFTAGAANGAVSLTGKYVSNTSGNAPTSFSVASDATVVAMTVTANTPPVSLTSGSTTTISPISISEPPNYPANEALTAGAVTIGITSGNATFAATAPTVRQTGTVSGTAPATPTAPTAGSTSYSGVSAAQANTATTSQLTITGLQLNYLSAGPVSATLTYTAQTGAISLGSVTIASAIGSSNRIYGTDGTAAGTVAQEFETAFPNGTSTAVLTTSLDPYDALSAAYLEGHLGTGLLITPQDTLGADAAAALRFDGVSTVYVVGGPDAVSPNVINQLKSTPVYTNQGTVATSTDITVVGPIYGQNADQTAEQVATYYNASYGALNITGAYSAATSTTGGGAFNDTTGNASASGPSGSASTVFVIANNDWRDATTLGPIAYADQIPVVLTPPDQNTLGASASTALKTLAPKQIVVVGGQLAFPNALVTQLQSLNGGTSVLRIAGQDYTDTAVQLAKFETAAAGTGLGWNPTGILVSHGDYWTDALGAAALGGTNLQIGATSYGNEPILLTENPTTIGTYLQGWLTSQGGGNIQTVNVLGGPLAVTASVVSSIQSSLAS